MSKSSFYHYFQSKEDLFKQALDQALAPLLMALDALDISLLTEQTFWPTVQMMVEEMARLANRSPEVVMVGRMFYRSLDNPEDRALTGEVMRASTDWLTAIIAHGQHLGLLRTDLPESLLIEATMSVGMALDRWILTRWDEFSDQERVALSVKTFDLFLRMLEPREG